MIWLNIFFLLFIGLLPLSTALLGRHDLERVTLIAYGLNLLAAEFLRCASLWYATVHPHLVEADSMRRSFGRVVGGSCLDLASPPSRSSFRS